MITLKADKKIPHIVNKQRIVVERRQANGRRVWRCHPETANEIVREINAVKGWKPCPS